jgi:hypothetical protein
MIDHSTPLQVRGRVDDRMAEMEARRLAAEARAGSTRTHWLTGELRAALHSTATVVTRLRHAHLRPGPRLAAGHHRA